MDEKPRQTLDDLRAAYDAQQEYELDRPSRLAEWEAAVAAYQEKWAELNQQRRDSQQRYPGTAPWLRLRFQ